MRSDGISSITCAICDDTRRVLRFSSGRECAWFLGWNYAFATKPRVCPCPHTKSGTWGDKKARMRQLEELSERGTVTLVEGFTL